MWPIKKMKKKPSQRHISKFAELDGGRGFSGRKKNLRGWKPNRKFYKG